MNYDEYGEVINGPETYKIIAEELKLDNSCFIGWTDQAGTHLDILFTINPTTAGNNIQGGLRPAKDLFVSIMRFGAFGFEINDHETHSGYYQEKLGRNLGSTAEKLGELINNVKKLL